MARYFNWVSGSEGNYLGGSSPVSAYPITMSIWFNPDRNDNTYDAMFLGASGSEYVGIYLNLANSSGNAYVTATVNDSVYAATSNQYAAETWNHAAATFGSNTNRRAFLNGQGGTVNTTTRSMTTPVNTMIGGFNIGSNVFGAMGGDLADAAVWNIVLTDAEIVALSKGVSPLNIRPSNLMAYWPIYGISSPEPNLARTGSALNLTLGATGGATSFQVPHPPVRRPFAGTSGIVMPPAFVPTGRTKIWNGSTWELKPVKVWTGSAWIEKPAKIWNGSAWV